VRPPVVAKSSMSVVRQVYEGRIVSLRLEEVSLPNGGKVTLEVVHHPGAAAVVAVDDEGEVALLRQYRHAAGGFIWEVPAGTLKGEETPGSCAVRELREEAGLDAAQWTELGCIFTTPGFCDERIYLFLARGLSACEQRLDEDEVLTVSRFSLTRAIDMIRAGEIRDAKSIAALHHAAARLGVLGR
jgi:ADP-ribose pyrophosphatase